VRQEAFERARAAEWERFERALASIALRKVVADFPRLYRVLCQDLVLARDRRFDAALVQRLNALALRGHQVLYGAGLAQGGFLDLFLRRFPRAVRREWRLALLLSVFFYGSFAATFLGVRSKPDLVYSIVDEAQVASFEAMYDPASDHFDEPRGAAEGVGMFFFYVGNNVGVDFRTFAGGILFGIGSLFIIGINGVLIGAVAGHISNVGYGETFYPFVIGHGSFELTAVVLSGVAGMRMGLALLVTGPRSRGAMLRAATLRSVPILYGTIAITVIAAVIEALWSGQPVIPAQVRYAVGAGLWLLVIVWLALGGRRWRRA